MDFLLSLSSSSLLSSQSFIVDDAKLSPQLAARTPSVARGAYLVIAGDETTVDRFSRHFPGKLTIIDPNQRRKAISS